MKEAETIVDLSGVLPVDTREFEILKPGGVEGTGWVITFAGPAHPKAVAYQDELSRKALRRQQLQEQAQINGRKYKAEDRTVDEQRRDNVAWVVSRIVAWTPIRIPPIQDDPIRFSDEAATNLLIRPEMGWALLQMVEFLNDERSFTPRSAMTSEPSQSAGSHSRRETRTE